MFICFGCKMKQFAIICISLIVCFESINVNSFAARADYAPDIQLPITDEKIACITKTVKGMILNPFLIPWALDFKKTFGDGVTNSAKICEQLEQPERRECFAQLKVKANFEYNRLVNKLPKGKRNKFHEDIAKCFEN